MTPDQTRYPASPLSRIDRQLAAAIMADAAEDRDEPSSEPWFAAASYDAQPAATLSWPRIFPGL